MRKNVGKRSLAWVLAFLMIFAAFLQAPIAAYADDQGVDVEWGNLRNSETNNGVTDRPAMTGPEFANLKWAEKYGTGWAAAPTPPLILDGHLYSGVGNQVVKIDMTTGKEVARSDAMVANVGYAMNPIVYGNGYLFVQVGNGRIQAIDFKTLKCAWATEKIGGQTVSPITYHENKTTGEGYVYLGTWSGEQSDGSFFCVTADDKDVTDGIKALKWKFTPSADDTALADDANKARGFYWAGSYATDDYVAVGSDDGTREGDYTANAVFYTLDPETGAIIDRIDQIKGDVRSTAVYDNGYLYFNTKGGLLYRTAVDSTGHFSDTSSMSLGGMTTASCLIYNNRLYLGIAGKGGQFDPDAGHHFAVVDVSSALTEDSVIYDIPIKGYPQAAALMSTSEVNEDYNQDGKADGRVYIYFTYNAQPGGIYYIYDEPGQETPASKRGELFIPPTGLQQYCISTLCMDRKGTIYYKNDSCNLFAVENNPAYLKDVTIVPSTGEANWDVAYRPGQAEYTLKVVPDATKVDLTLDLPEGIQATVDGKAYQGKTVVDLPAGQETTDATVQVKYTDFTRTYTFHIVRQSEDTTLSELKVSDSNIYPSGVGIALTTPFRSDVTEYETVLTSLNSNGFLNVWPTATAEKATYKVYPVSNVGGRTKLEADGSIARTSMYAGHGRYAVYAENPQRNMQVKVVVTSESGSKTGTYTLTLVTCVNVTDVELNQTSLSLSEGETATLQATITPENATDQTVTWETSDEGVAKVDQTGQVTAVAKGTATITATTADGGKQATCQVTVEKVAEATITIVSQQGKNAYENVLTDVVVSAEAATKAGYTKAPAFQKQITVIDALVVLHQNLYGEEFNNNPTKYLVMDSRGSISTIFGKKTYSLGYFVNNEFPVYADNPKMGSVANDTVLKISDTLNVFMYNSPYYAEKYLYFGSKAYETVVGTPVTVNVQGFYAMMDRTPESEEGATVVVKDAAGKEIAQAVTDADGNATLTLENAGDYTLTISAMEEDDMWGDYFVAPYSKLTVTEDTLAQPKADAQAELEGYGDRSLYRVAQWSDFATAKTDGATAIDQATSQEAVNQALADAKAKIDALPTAASLNQTKAGILYLTVEKTTIGQGYLVAPTKVDFYEGETVADVWERYAKEQGLQLDSGMGQWGYYLTSINDAEGSLTATFPAYIVDAAKAAGTNLVNPRASSLLGSGDYAESSGWMFNVNNANAQQSANGIAAADGMTVRYAFSVIGWGGDVWDTGWGQPIVPAVNDHTDMIKALADFDQRGDRAALMADPAVKTAYDNLVAGSLDYATDAAQSAALIKALEDAIANIPLQAAKDAAEERLTNYKNPADYRPAQQDELAIAVADGIANIQAAQSMDEVEQAYEAAKRIIDAIKTDAQLTAEEQGQPGQPVTYAMLEGMNGEYLLGGTVPAYFRADGPYNKFTGVSIDGVQIGNDSYTSQSGSTIVNLLPDYLNTLSAGQHTITVHFVDGAASTVFTLKADAGSGVVPGTGAGTGQGGAGQTITDLTVASTGAAAKTGDASQQALMWILLTLAAGTLMMVTLDRKQRHHR